MNRLSEDSSVGVRHAAPFCQKSGLTTFGWTLALAALLAACSGGGPMRSFTEGDELAYYDFSASSQFEQGMYTNASLLVRDGIYRIDVREGDNELWWGQWGETYDNVVIDVDVEQLSERNENAYGIMCRVRGAVGQPVDVSDLQATPLAVEPEVTAEPTNEATPEATEAATEQATAEATTEATSEATAEGTAEARAGALAAAQGMAQMLAATDEATAGAAQEATEAAAETAEPTEAMTEEPTEEVTEAATARAEAAEQATAEATEERTPEATAESTAAATLLEASNGDGYLFLIQGSGSAAIMRARGRDLQPLADWRTAQAIQVGPAANHLRAVCVGDYLAFYVNDQLVAEAIDDTYERGQVGLAASAANRLGVRVEFDNLMVAVATPG